MLLIHLLFGFFAAKGHSYNSAIKQLNNPDHVQSHIIFIIRLMTFGASLSWVKKQTNHSHLFS